MPQEVVYLPNQLFNLSVGRRDLPANLSITRSLVMHHTSNRHFMKLKLSRLLMLIASILSIGLLGHRTALAGGTLDSAFGSGGKVNVDFGGGTDYSDTVLLQTDGKIVIVGTSGGDAALARLNSDGSLDGSFGIGGKTTTDFFPSQFTVQDAALQPDGKIVVVGSLEHPNGLPPQEITLVRYNLNGTLDTSFDGDGRLFITFPNVCDGLAVAVQADGKILAGGGNRFSSGGSFAVLVRVNANGALDTTFDGDGIVSEAGPPKIQIRVQSNGRILVGAGALESVITVSRYNANGSRDTSFANSVYGPFDISADDKILGRVSTTTPTPGGYRVQRFNSDGSIDSSFTNNRNDFFNVFDIAPAASGQVVEVGSYYDGTYSSFGVSFFKSNGLLSNFTREFPGALPGYTHAVDTVAQPDGKILVLGDAYFSVPSGTQDFTLVRYLNVAPSAVKPSDFDGDSRSDYAVYRAGATPSAPSYWHVLRSSDNTYVGVQFGAGEDKIVPADYDGDGKTDFGVFRPSTGFWYTSLNSANNYGALKFGQSGDIPLPGDFDGDGKADHAVFRPSNGFWYILRSSDGSLMFRQFGTGADKPVLGDFDGDGKTDLAYINTVGSDYFWHIFQSINNSPFIIRFGIVGDKVVPGDYDGDGRTDFAIFRPSTNKWYTSTDPGTNYGEKEWGISGDRVAPGDFDGDGHTDLTMFRPGDSTWYVLRSSSNIQTGQQWGISTDLPVTAAFIP
jgi:uncharacterized delta-60 repeat protein